MTYQKNRSWLYRMPYWSKCRESTGNELPLCFVYPYTYNNYQYRVILGLSHFSLTGTVSTSPNLPKEGARSATIIKDLNKDPRRRISTTTVVGAGDLGLDYGFRAKCKPLRFRFQKTKRRRLR